MSSETEIIDLDRKAQEKAKRNKIYKKKYYRKVLQDKRHYCELCDVVFLAKSALANHNKTKKHQRIVAVFDQNLLSKNKGVAYL